MKRGGTLECSRIAAKTSDALVELNVGAAEPAAATLSESREHLGGDGEEEDSEHNAAAVGPIETKAGKRASLYSGQRRGGDTGFDAVLSLRNLLQEEVSGRLRSIPRHFTTVVVVLAVHRDRELAWLARLGGKFTNLFNGFYVQYVAL
jgi:hypothetical protein